MLSLFIVSISLLISAHGTSVAPQRPILEQPLHALMSDHLREYIEGHFKSIGLDLTESARSLVSETFFSEHFPRRPGVATFQLEISSAERFLRIALARQGLTMNMLPADLRAYTEDAGDVRFRPLQSFDFKSCRDFGNLALLKLSDSGHFTALDLLRSFEHELGAVDLMGWLGPDGHSIKELIDCMVSVIHRSDRARRNFPVPMPSATKAWLESVANLTDDAKLRAACAIFLDRI